MLQHRELAKVFSHRTEEWSEDFDKDELLVLGDGPRPMGGGECALGVFVEEHFNTAPDWAVIHGGYDPMQLDFAAEKGAYAYRMGGQWDGNSHIKRAPDISMFWKQAANMTQWRRAPGLAPIGPELLHIVDRLKKDEP